MYKKIKIPKKIKKKELLKFFKDLNLDFLINQSFQTDLKVNEINPLSPYKPELTDLYRLYKFVVLNKRTTILEYGSGWSTLIFLIAMDHLKKKYASEIKTLRRNNPFEIFSIENEKKYLNITKKRNSIFFKNKKMPKIRYVFSDVEMTTYNGKICTEYKNHPTCSPDFIYLDGPDKFNVKKKINNITFKHKDMMSMVSDILKLEYFYTPGTIILIDGRGANAKFLKDNLKRNWLYKNDHINDQHIFYLNDDALGKYNKLQLKFYM